MCNLLIVLQAGVPQGVGALPVGSVYGLLTTIAAADPPDGVRSRRGENRGC